VIGNFDICHGIYKKLLTGRKWRP